MNEKNPNGSPSKLSPVVWRLGLVSFFADISTEMLYPITPLFLTTVLGASMASVGLIEGVAEALASFLKIYSGLLSDRMKKRRPLVAAGYFLAAIAKPIVGMSSSWEQVLFARGLDRTGKGLRGAPRDAWIADSVSKETRGSAFGWHRGMDTLGAFLGPLLTIVFLSNQENLRPLYYWALLPGLFATALILWVPEKPREIGVVKNKSKIEWSSIKDLPKEFYKYLFGWIIFSVANSSDVFLLMKARQSAHVDFRVVVLLYCFYNLTYAGFSPWLGGLSDRFGRKFPLLGGLLLFCLVYLGFGYADELWQFTVLFGFYGIYMAATDGVGKAWAVDLLPASLKGTGLGLLGMVSGVAAIVASGFAGFLWDHWNPAATFLYGAVGSAAAFILFLFLKETTSDKKN